MPVRSGIERVLRHLDAPTVDAIGVVFDDWAGVVGERIAANTRPVSLGDGRLVLAVVDPAWASQLMWLERELLDAIAARVGPGVVIAVDVKVRSSANGVAERRRTR